MKSKSFKNLIAIVIFLVLIGVWVLISSSNQPYTREEYALDTVIYFSIYDNKENVEKDINRIVKEFHRYEQTVDYYDSNSELSKLNRALMKNEAFTPSKELESIIELSLKLAKETEGAFDPTIGRLVDAWNFSRGGRVPSEVEIRDALRTASYQNLIVDESKIHSSKKLKVDLGAISKGYALDIARDILINKGYENFVINCISSTVVEGEKNGKPFKVGIQHPRKDGLLAVVYAKDGETISTSGDYQRYFTVNGKRYHHILNPKTGKPAGDFQSVTVVSKRPSAETDALSTAIFVMGEEKGISFAKDEGLKIFAVRKNGETVILPEGNWIEIMK